MAKQAGQLLQIGDRVEVARRLLAAEAAVEVGADAGVVGVAGELTDVIDVIDHVRQRHAGRLRGRHAAFPAGDQHPRVERRADHAAALDHALQLLVAELPVARHKGAAIAMARPDRAAKKIHRLVKRLVAQVGHVEDYAEPLHLAEQIRPRLAKATALVGAGRVGARAVMRRAKRAQPALVCTLEVLQRHDRVRPLEAQDIANR